MKRFLSIVIAVCMVAAMLGFEAYAAKEPPVFTYYKDGYEYTVVFEETELSAKQQELLAMNLVGISLSDSNLHNSRACSHTLTTSTASVITHKVYATSPRCRRDIYKVTSCTKCSYSTRTLLSSSYIVCC